MTPDLLRQLFAPGRGWMADARCIDAAPEAFFVARGHDPSDAKDICDLCPVANECLDYALTYRIRHGVWGGASANERSQMDKPPLPLSPCGTNAAYGRHVKAGEDPCGPCREAHNAYKVRRDRMTA